MADWKDILSDKEEQLTDEDLLKYLHESLSEEEKNNAEEKIAGAFESDALDGLQQIKDKAKLQNLIKQLHQKLPQLLLLKKQRLQKRKVKDLDWIILTLIILLFLCIISYVIITVHN